MLQKNIYPESVINIRANPQFLRRRFKELQNSKPAGELKKWSGDKLNQKIATFLEENSIELFKQYSASQGQNEGQKFPLVKFFQENQTEVFDCDAEADEYEMFESMRIYIERFGRPYNYLASVNFLNQEREKYLDEEEIKRKEKEEEIEKQKVVEIEAQKKALE